jgi:UvrD/REP helicase N-terminal domain
MVSRFAPDSPLEGDGFEPSVPCKAPDTDAFKRRCLANVCGCRACSLGASNDSRRLPAVPTVGDSGHERLSLSRPGGIARSNPRCYAISVERKQNIAATARAIDVLLEGLNPAQRSAATYGIEAEQGPPPLLIAAGAGTGKTKTLAHRVVRLILGGADPRRLLLLTFTRRAALEMTRRAQQILVASQRGRAAGGAEAVLLPWSGTFHSIGNRLLRRHAATLSLDPAFTVLSLARRGAA